MTKSYFVPMLGKKASSESSRKTEKRNPVSPVGSFSSPISLLPGVIEREK